MLWQRILAAVIGIPLIVYVFYRGGIILLAGVYLLIFIALAEMINIIKHSGFRGLILPLWFSAIIFPLMIQYNCNMIGITAFLIMLFCSSYFLAGYSRLSTPDLGLTLLAIIYVVVGFSHFLLLRSMDNGFWIIIYVFLVVWGTDTGAYFSGIHFGKHKLALGISPNKTWEGFFGGLLVSFLVIFLYISFISVPENKIFLYLTPFISVSGQIGDLFESALKRFAKIKDSGDIIPGHGGILDRFDSALWAAPLTYHILILIERLS